MSEWQPIATAPKDGTLVLCCAEDWERPAVLAWHDRWDDGSGDSYQDYQPTQWMPLPPPPTAVEPGPSLSTPRLEEVMERYIRPMRQREDEKLAEHIRAMYAPKDDAP